MSPTTTTTTDPISRPRPSPQEIIHYFQTANDLTEKVYKHAEEHLEPLILAHSLRVFLYAQAIGLREESGWIRADCVPFLFTACLFHDIGTSSAHNDTDLRFEVEGADVAKAMLLRHGAAEHAAHAVWVAIAVHTSPQIAERISPLARLVRLAVKVDFKGEEAMRFTSAEEVAKIEGAFPRGQIERLLGHLVTHQAAGKPGKAPGGSWPNDLLRAFEADPSWLGINKGF
jgi:hypothetical protein